MSYLSAELAHDAPQELYEFHRGTETVYLASGDVAVSVLGHTYQPVGITRRELTGSQEEGSGSVVLELPATHPVAQWFDTRFQPARVTATVFRRHRTDPATAVLVSGVVETAAIKEGGVCALTIAPLARALRQELPRFLVQTNCNRKLGDSGCRVDLAAGGHIKAGTVTNLTGSKLTFSGLAATDFVPGALIEGVVSATLADGTAWSTTITAHAAAGQIYLLNAPSRAQLPVATALSITRGCLRTPGACRQYNNIARYGGFPYMPVVDPFAGATPAKPVK
jgi:hypothetical protein